jgi:hypothetical protein
MCYTYVVGTKDNNMDQYLPRFMSMKDFEAHVGMSHHLFRRICDRYQIPRVPQGNALMVEVGPTMRTLAEVPGIERLMSDRGVELIKPLLAEAIATQDDYLSDEASHSPLEYRDR